MVLMRLIKKIQRLINWIAQLLKDTYRVKGLQKFVEFHSPPPAKNYEKLASISPLESLWRYGINFE